MFRRSYTPKAHVSNVLYTYDSIVRKFLFQRIDIPESVIGVPMFRKSYSPMDDQTVLCSMTLWPYRQIDIIQM